MKIHFTKVKKEKEKKKKTCKKKETRGEKNIHKREEVHIKTVNTNGGISN